MASQSGCKAPSALLTDHRYTPLGTTNTAPFLTAFTLLNGGFFNIFSLLSSEFVMMMSGFRMIICSSFIIFEILKSVSLSWELKFIPPAIFMYSAPYWCKFYPALRLNFAPKDAYATPCELSAENTPAQRLHLHKASQQKVARYSDCKNFIAHLIINCEPVFSN